MKIKLLSFLVLFFFAGQSAYAATFIVTSNDDSGPGTLREAITMVNANGVAINDTIVFNIVDISQSGRTINLQTPLPSLTSRLVIDASQQPGSSFGISNAKIILSLSNSNTSFSYFEINNCKYVEVYSIFFLQPILTTNVVSSAVSISKSDTIKIGAPGKGNYILGCYYGIRGPDAFAPSDTSHFVHIKSNIIGLNEIGIATDSFQNNKYSYIVNSIYLRNMENVEVGGSTIAEGNRIGTNGLFFTGDSYQNGTLDIQNNYFGTNADGTENIHNFIDCRITISPAFHDDLKVTFHNNILNGKLFLIWIGARGFSLKQNTIFSNKVLSSTDFRITMQACLKGIIGGDTPGEGNIIRSNYNNPFYYFTWWSKQGSIRNDGSNVTIRNNLMLCNSYYGSSIEHYLSGYDPSACQIDSTGINFVRGKATPNSRIDVYLDDDCLACEGKQFLGFTFANADSTWSFTGNFNQTVVATSTNSLGKTSEFSQPLVFPTDLTRIKNPTCGQNNGSIKNLVTKGADNVIWRRFYMINNIWYDSVFSNSLDIANLGTGKYVVEARLGTSCRSAFQIFDLTDVSPIIDESNANLIHPGCGLFNGSITNISIYNNQFSLIEWKNEQGTVISNTLDLTNAGSGRYKLYLRDTTLGGGCSDSTIWYDLINQSGPTVSTNNLQIIPATCGNANGSITGITSTSVTGNPFIQWLDSLNNPVGNALDLQNVKAGKYKLKFKDQSSCDTIITPYYTVPSIGIITIDTTTKIIASAGCTINNGSIRNIQVTGATSLQWQNLTTNSPVGITLNISNLSAGSYRLTANNITGCTAIVTLTVPQAAFSPITVTGVQTRNALCAANTGLIKIISFSITPAFHTFRWVDSVSNQIIATGIQALNLGGGTYFTIATDTNGCEQQILKTKIAAFPQPVFNYSQMLVTDDVCSLQKGSISGITLQGLNGPTLYRWINGNNDTVSTLPNLQNVSAGQYRLITIDGAICKTESNWIIVGNTNTTLNPPIYEELIIPRNTLATITLRNAEPATYLLFSNLNSIIPSKQNSTGNFTVGPVANDTVVYVRKESGTCVTNRVAVRIKVVDKSVFAIASAFTPNNDGLNDKLRVQIIGFINLEYFKVFNRNGEEVFSTKTINDGWDGKYKGVPQSTSVFVWIAKGRDINGNIISDKGTFVLIR